MDKPNYSDNENEANTSDEKIATAKTTQLEVYQYGNCRKPCNLKAFYAFAYPANVNKM